MAMKEGSKNKNAPPKHTSLYEVLRVIKSGKLEKRPGKRALYVSNILISDNVSAITELVVRSFSGEKVDRFVPWLDEHDVQLAANKIAELGGAIQALDAWGALPIEPQYLSARKQLFARATKNCDTVLSKPFKMKLEEFRITADDVAQLVVCFDGDEMAVGYYLKSVACVFEHHVPVAEIRQAQAAAT